jgi:predicted nucleic acid-binding protein
VTVFVDSAAFFALLDEDDDARRLGIEHAFAFDRVFSAAGLTFPPGGEGPR